jgi:hypothetical protein
MDYGSPGSGSKLFLYSPSICSEFDIMSCERWRCNEESFPSAYIRQMLRFHPAAVMAVWMVMVVILLFIPHLRTPVFHVAA